MSSSLGTQGIENRQGVYLRRPLQGLIGASPCAERESRRDVKATLRGPERPHGPAPLLITGGKCSRICRVAIFSPARDPRGPRFSRCYHSVRDHPDQRKLPLGGFTGPAGIYNADFVYCRTRLQGSEKEVQVAGVAYVSQVRVEPVEGRIRRAHLPAEEEPVMFGVHSEVA